MYGVLYAYTPEVFPAPHRGTGDALCSAFNRITGILAPVIKIATTPASGGGSSATANGCALLFRLDIYRGLNVKLVLIVLRSI